MVAGGAMPVAPVFFMFFRSPGGATGRRGGPLGPPSPRHRPTRTCWASPAVLAASPAGAAQPLLERLGAAADPGDCRSVGWFLWGVCLGRQSYGSPMECLKKGIPGGTGGICDKD